MKGGSKMETTIELLESDKKNTELTIKELYYTKSILDTTSRTSVVRDVKRKFLKDIVCEINCNMCILDELNQSIVFIEERNR